MAVWKRGRSGIRRGVGDRVRDVARAATLPDGTTAVPRGRAACGTRSKGGFAKWGGGRVGVWRRGARGARRDRPGIRGVRRRRRTRRGAGGRRGRDSPLPPPDGPRGSPAASTTGPSRWCTAHGSAGALGCRGTRRGPRSQAGPAPAQATAEWRPWPISGVGGGGRLRGRKTVCAPKNDLQLGPF